MSDINVLNKVNFKNLKELYLHKNNIFYINVLENAKFENLILSNLGENKISDISVLERVNFRELETLYLQKNNISDIKVLENAKFEKLKALNISTNKIFDINTIFLEIKKRLL